MEDGHRARVVAAYRLWAESYDRLLRRTYHRVERAITRRHLLAHLPARPDARLLDVGGGDARQAQSLLAAGRAGHATILDLSTDMLALAGKRLSRVGAAAEFVCGDAEALPFHERSHDLALLLGGVLSHCPRPERALSEVRRVLKPGAFVAVSVDNLAVAVRTACRERIPEALRGALGTGRAALFHRHPFPFDVRFFTPEEIRSACEAAGIIVVSMIGKPVFTHFSAPSEVLSGPQVEPRVDLEWPFVSDPRFLPYADQIEVIGRVK